MWMIENSFKEQSGKLLQAFDFAAEMAAMEQEHQAQWKALLLSLLEVMDSCDRLLAGIGGTKEPTPERTAACLNTFRLVATQLEHALQEAGLASMACLGQVADPQRHEIVEVKVMDGVEDDVIIGVMRRGYEWNGELLRRPQIVVARNVRTQGRKSDESYRH
jgi:molecular chaperone GrpE